MWVPWLRWIRRNMHGGQRFVVYCHKGHEHLYEDFATEVVGIKVEGITAVDCVSAWVEGIRLRRRDYGELVLNHHLEKRRPINIITPLDLSYQWPPKSPPRLNRSEHFTYGTPADKQEGWVAIHARNCKTNQERNWPMVTWCELVNRLTDLSECIRHRATVNNDGGAVPIWELAGEFGETRPADLFRAIYLALLGKPRGPRAGSFLTVLGVEFAVRRFREASGETS